MAVEEEITQEQAEDALHQLLPTLAGGSEDQDQDDWVEPEPEEQASEQPEPEEVAAAGTEGGEEEAAVEEGEQPEAVEAQPEPVLEDTQKLYDERLAALKQRHEKSQSILQDRLLRKSTATDSALKLLEATLTDEGVRPEDVKNVIAQLKGTMNPASPSYAPPPAPDTSQTTAAEDQEMILNDFLNDANMTLAEQESFTKWIQTEAATVMPQAEQNVARSSLDGFLRLAHMRWNSGVSEKDKVTKTNDAVEAVKSVQRTQRAAAKAASAKPAAPVKQSAGPRRGTDLSELSKDDISDLLRQSVEQYR